MIKLDGERGGRGDEPDGEEGENFSITNNKKETIFIKFLIKFIEKLLK